MSNGGQAVLSIVGGVVGFIYGGPLGAALDCAKAVALISARVNAAKLAVRIMTSPLGIPLPDIAIVRRFKLQPQGRNFQYFGT